MSRRLELTLTLARKDWRRFWADRRAAIMVFAVPILLASAFGLIFHQTPHEPTQLPVVVVVEEPGPFSRLVANDLLVSQRLDAQELPREEAEALVAQRRAVAIVLPRGLERLQHWQPDSAGERPTLVLLHHPGANTEKQWAEGVVTETVMQRVAREAFGADAHELAPPFRVQSAAVTTHPNAQFNSYTHSFCGMTIQYLLLWGMESGLVLLRERQRPVWSRLRAAAVPLSCILTGQAIATAAVAIFQIILTFTFGYVVFGVKVEGSLLGFGLLAIAAGGLAAATGLTVAAVGGTETRARSISILLILTLAMLGGLWVPAFLLPGWVRDIGWFLPTSWAMHGLESVTWQQASLTEVLPSFGVVFGFTAVLLILATLRLGQAERNWPRGEF